MAAAFYYFSREDLDAALGRNTVAAIYSDDASGTPDEAALIGCFSYGTAECNSFLRGIHAAAIPVSEEDIVDEVKFGALDFGIAYTMRRRPDLVRAMGEESWTTFRDSAIERMKRYVSSLQRMPPSMGTPSNVGGEVIQPATSTCATPDVAPAMWGDMGDFSR